MEERLRQMEAQLEEKYQELLRVNTSHTTFSKFLTLFSVKNASHQAQSTHNTNTVPPPVWKHQLLRDLCVIIHVLCALCETLVKKKGQIC